MIFIMKNMDVPKRINLVILLQFYCLLEFFSLSLDIHTLHGH